jgi:TM2 domain-containing membrane protein YozV
MSLVATKSTLSERELALLESEMRARSKSTLVAFVLWLFLGMLGAHRFYLNRKGIAFVVTFVVGLALTVIIVGFLVLFVEGIFVLIDAFRLPRFVEQANAATEQQVITEILAARATAPGASPA